MEVNDPLDARSSTCSDSLLIIDQVRLNCLAHPEAGEWAGERSPLSVSTSASVMHRRRLIHRSHDSY